MIMKAKSEPLKVLSVRLPWSLYQRVKAAAHGQTADDSVSIADFIREALEHDLQHKEPHAPPQDNSRDVSPSRSASWLPGPASK